MLYITKISAVIVVRYWQEYLWTQYFAQHGLLMQGQLIYLSSLPGMRLFWTGLTWTNIADIVWPGSMVLLVVTVGHCKRETSYKLCLIPSFPDWSVFLRSIEQGHSWIICLAEVILVSLGHFWKFWWSGAQCLTEPYGTDTILQAFLDKLKGLVTLWSLGDGSKTLGIHVTLRDGLI